MTILVTGSAGHLGEALMRTLLEGGYQSIGVDVKRSAFTHEVGSITDRSFVKRCMRGVHAVLHTATLHKPHVATHTRQDFVDTNITGTLNLLEEATATGASFVFTSTTSVFGRALTPPLRAPAAWITEDVVPVPKNIYGVTKLAAENLCELFHRVDGLSCLILRTSRFFPEEDDCKETRQSYDDANVKVNERARNELGWRPRYDFAYIIDLVRAGQDPRSPLARTVGSKGYHADAFADGPYPT